MSARRHLFVFRGRRGDLLKNLKPSHEFLDLDDLGGRQIIYISPFSQHFFETINRYRFCNIIIHIII